MNRATAQMQGFGLLQLGMAIAALALIAVIVTGVRGYLEGIRTTADRAGYDRAMGKVAERDNMALLDAQARVKVLQSEKEALERRAANNQAEISANYQKGLADGKARTDRFIADVRAGRIVLRDAGGRAAGAPDGAGGQGPGASSTAGGRDGQAGCQLSEAAAGFLLGLTGEADDLARQLGACQALILKDREICR